MKGILKAVWILPFALSVFVFADEAQEESSVSVAEMKAELDMRDSVMAARDNAYKAEGDSLRTVISVEQAKSTNWEQSYNTVMQENNTCQQNYSAVRKDNDICQQALRVSIEAQTEKNKKGGRSDAAMMSGSAFLGGVGIGMLLFWLIFD